MVHKKTIYNRRWRQMPYVIQSETVSDIADAIRYKGNLEGEIKVEDFA